MPVIKLAGKLVFYEPAFFFNIQLQVFPTEERFLYADDEAPEWEEITFVTLDPKATAQVFTGSTSLGVQMTTGSKFGWMPPEPVVGFGYRLRFAFHPGEAEFTSFNVTFIGSENSRRLVPLVGGAQDDPPFADVEQREWQIVEIPLSPLSLSAPNEPIQSMAFGGTLKGTFYLDDIRLVPELLPPPPRSTAVLEDHQSTEPTDFALDQNYPNPFNSGTVIRFALPQSDHIDLSLYNMTGQRVATLVEGTRPAGTYTVRWDGRDASGIELASGVYLYLLQAGSQVETRKLLLLR